MIEIPRGLIKNPEAPSTEEAINSIEHALENNSYHKALINTLNISDLEEVVREEKDISKGMKLSKLINKLEVKKSETQVTDEVITAKKAIKVVDTVLNSKNGDLVNALDAIAIAIAKIINSESDNLLAHKLNKLLNALVEQKLRIEYGTTSSVKKAINA
jgi:hypothetical protein